MFAVNNSAGGLGLLWNNSIKLEILGYSKYHIDAKVDDFGPKPWRLTLVYGEAQTSERFNTWNTLKDISSTSNIPWVLWENLMKFYITMSMKE